MAGASAALTGLLFVAVSVDLARIASHRPLRAGAAETLLRPLTPLFISIVIAIPAQWTWQLGLEFLALAGLVGGIWLNLGYTLPQRSARWWMGWRGAWRRCGGKS